MNELEQNERGLTPEKEHIEDGNIDSSAVVKEVSKAEKKLEILEQELEEEKNCHLRTLADFDNFRKRVERDAEVRNTQGKKVIMMDLLTVLDNLKRAIEQVREEQVARGLQIVYQQFLDLFQRHGAFPIETIGKAFNPEEHEGVGFIESNDYPEGCVAEELSSGYRFGNELLRPARVRVAKKEVEDSKSKVDNDVF